MNKPVLQCQSVTHEYVQGDESVAVLKALNFELNSGERVAIMGSSGAGKSTLLNLLGGLDNPTAGSVSLVGQDFGMLNADKRAALRNQYLGFVYQFHHLLPEFSALENAAMPCLISGMKQSQAYQLATAMLSDVGLADRLQHRPAQLSGGERQRVAIARALVMKPACILMDEPTGNLDVETATQVFNVINSVCANVGVALVIVTHDPVLAQKMDKMLELSDGQLRAVA